MSLLSSVGESNQARSSYLLNAHYYFYTKTDFWLQRSCTFSLLKALLITNPAKIIPHIIHLNQINALSEKEMNSLVQINWKCKNKITYAEMFLYKAFHE